MTQLYSDFFQFFKVFLVFLTEAEFTHSFHRTYRLMAILTLHCHLISKAQSTPQ